jgi:hypothetical protein
MIKFILLIPLVFLFASTSSAQQKKMVKPVREFVDLTQLGDGEEKEV